MPALGGESSCVATVDGGPRLPFFSPALSSLTTSTSSPNWEKWERTVSVETGQIKSRKKGHVRVALEVTPRMATPPPPSLPCRPPSAAHAACRIPCRQWATARAVQAPMRAHSPQNHIHPATHPRSCSTTAPPKTVSPAPRPRRPPPRTRAAWTRRPRRAAVRPGPRRRRRPSRLCVGSQRVRGGGCPHV